MCTPNPIPRVAVITILQVLAGLARPGVGARLRPVFNWAHRLSGLSGLVLALAALFLAQPLPQPGLPRAWLWILTAVVAVDAVVSLAFLVSQLVSRSPFSFHVKFNSGERNFRARN